MDQPTVSIIIPAFNCEKTISQTIDACLKQTYPSSEIIVVDDGSTDGTSRIPGDYAQLMYIRQDNAGPAAARNMGVKEASSSILVFTDSDCIPHADWLEKMIAPFDKDEIGAVAGSYGIANNKSLLAQCIQDEIVYRHKNMPQHIKAFGSYNCAIRKDIFERAGGFDMAFRRASGEDNDLSYKILGLGKKIYFEPHGLVDHFHTTSITKYLKEQYRHGFWRAKLYFAHPGRTSGDDYTFWKDLLETGVTFLIMLGACLSYGWPILWAYARILAVFLYLLELVFGLVTQKGIFKAIIFSWVMYFRAFVRTLGFSTGIIFFLFQLPFKKS